MSAMGALMFFSITNQMSFLFIEFNFCPRKQRKSNCENNSLWLLRLDTRIEISQSTKLIQVQVITFKSRLDVMQNNMHTICPNNGKTIFQITRT